MNVEKIIIIGAGNGGLVVSDILRHMPDKNGWYETFEPIGFLDDNEKYWYKNINNIPVLGPISQIDSFDFDKIIISITSDMVLRKKLFNKYQRRYSFCNAIHPMAYINPSVKIGVGNIIGGFVHIGFGSVIRNNNLISSHTSIEHHNFLGNNILFGPNCSTSGDVTIGDNCILGAGVNVMPHINIGNDCSIASGLSVYKNMNSGMRMKYNDKLAKFIKDFY